MPFAMASCGNAGVSAEIDTETAKKTTKTEGHAELDQ
jgi:hypothetical protein